MFCVKCIQFIIKDNSRLRSWVQDLKQVRAMKQPLIWTDSGTFKSPLQSPKESGRHAELSTVCCAGAWTIRLRGFLTSNPGILAIIVLYFSVLSSTRCKARFKATGNPGLWFLFLFCIHIDNTHYQHGTKCSRYWVKIGYWFATWYK